MADTFVEWQPNRPYKQRVLGWAIDPSGCHLWRGSMRNGYGCVRIDGATKYVHRVRYEQEVGPIPDGMQLDHFACDRRECCNPMHVRPVTSRENMLRSESISARNRAKTHCVRGHLLEGQNLDAYSQKIGARGCKTCKRQGWLKFAAAHRAEAKARSLAYYYANRATVRAKQNARRSKASG